MNASQHRPEPSPAHASHLDGGFRRLHALAPVGLRARSCLHLNKPYVGCDECAQACPHDCLAPGEGTLELDPARCTACGLCAARCPTAALVVEGCEIVAPSPGTPLTLACGRVAGSPATADGRIRRLPCLGALTANDYLRLALACDGAPIRLVVGADCERCPTTAGRADPVGPVLEHARRALAAAGLPAGALPERLAAPSLPDGNRLAGDRSAKPPTGRRAFFAGLSRAFSAGVVHAAPAIAPHGRAQDHLPRPRTAVPVSRGTEMRLAALEIARRHGRGRPAAARLPRLTAGAACQAHGTCARACPSGALLLERRPRSVALQFDPWQCIACGACARVCPEQALTLEPPAWREFVAGPQRLAEVAQHECPRCGAPVRGAERDAPCERCSKSARLARAGFALFHPPHGEPVASPDPP